jgi:uncharacterized membrane protein (TIGR02234 family)
MPLEAKPQAPGPLEAGPLEAGPQAAETVAGRREFTLALALSAAGAGLILLALRQVWAHAIYAPPRPFPAQDLGISGQKLVPLASTLAIAALACLAAVIATRGILRRAVGVLLAVIGAGAAVTAAAVTSGAVLSAAVSADPTAGSFSGSTTSGTTSGNSAYSSTVIGNLPGHAVITGLPWHVAAVAGALAIVLAGLATAWRGTRWPAMSARFDRPGQRRRPGPADAATMWESLSRDVDPTDEVDFGSGAG